MKRVADYIADRTVERVELKMQAAQDAELRAAGCRASSPRTALERRGAGRLRSLEHLPEYATQTRALLTRHGFDADRADICDAPLRDVRVDGDTIPWYDVSAIADIDAIDVVVVDGPPGPLHPLARYPALPLLHDRVRSRGVVLLDDGDRPEEREIVRRWQAALPDWSVDELDLEKGAFRLRKP